MKILHFIAALLLAIPVFGQTSSFTNINASADTKSLTFTSQSANPADSGVIRLGNGELITWEAATPGTDLTFGLNSSNVFAFTAPISTTGSVSTGVGGSTAGVLELGQGTAPSDGTTSVKIYADTAVTSYKRKLPASVGSSGFTYQTVSGTTQTETQVSDAALATAVRATIIEKIAVFSVDGGGSAIASGTVSGTTRIPFACTLTGYSITATAATGTNTIKIWLKASATTIPVVGDSINTSGVSLTTGTAVASGTLSDFTDTVYAALDMARCSVTAVDGTATDITVTLYGTRL